MIKIDGETLVMSGSSRELLCELAVAVNHFVQMLADGSNFSYGEIHNVTIKEISEVSLMLNICSQLPEDKRKDVINKLVTETTKKISRP